MVTSFADGTKMSVEQAIVANATGMSVHKRGMLGRDHAGHVDELTDDVRHRGAAGARRRRRLRRRLQPGSRRVRSRRPRRPQAAALPRALQARQGAALQLLHALPPVPLRSPHHGGAGGADARCDRPCAADPVCRGGHYRQDRPEGGHGAGPPRRIPLLRRSREGTHRSRRNACCRSARPRAVACCAMSRRTRRSPTTTSRCRQVVLSTNFWKPSAHSRSACPPDC